MIRKTIATARLGFGLVAFFGLLLAHVVPVLATGATIPGGFVTVSGNQIVASTGVNVRLACMGYVNPGISGSYTQDMINYRNAGLNCARVDYWDNQTCPGGTCNFGLFDQYVAAAASQGVRLIFDHHGNDVNGTDGCLSQQENGLWYDLNGAAPYNVTNNTNGCGTAGTVTYAQFKANWVQFANHYAGNSTVLGFDLHNESLTYGLDTTQQLNWGGKAYNNITYAAGGGADYLAMINDVGGAIEAADPGALIIVEGPINNGVLLNGVNNPMTTGGIFDLTLAHSAPPSVSASHVVYSVHDYPSWIGDQTPDSGSGITTARNVAWGFLVQNNYAPIWVGEWGGDLNGTSFPNETPAQEQAWAAGIVAYMNGTAAGGPTFSGSQQGISSDWWAYGYGGSYPLGACSTSNCSAFNSFQSVYWQQVQYNPPTSKPKVPAPLTGTVTTQTWQAYDYAVPGVQLACGKPFHFIVLPPAQYSPTSYVYPLFIWLHPDYEGDSWYNGAASPTQLAQSGYEAASFNTVPFLTAYPAVIVAPSADQTNGNGTTGSCSGDGDDTVKNWGGWVNNGSTGSPTVYSGDTGPNVFALLGMITYLETQYSIDPSRIYVEGFSLGGIGAEYDMLKYNSVNGTLGNVFAAGASTGGVLEVNGYAAGPNTGNETTMSNVPVWWFSGANDTNSYPSHWNSPMATALGGGTSFPPAITSPSSNQIGTSSMHYTLCPTCGHQDTDASGNPVWTNSTIINWMFSISGNPAPPSSTGTTWNPLDKSSTITLSVGNTVATSGATGGQGVRTTTSKSAGKFCAAVTTNVTTPNIDFGIANAGEVLSGYLGGSASQGYGLYTQYGPGNQIFYNGSALSGGLSPGGNNNQTTIELDATASQFWIKNAFMNGWNNSPTANPETGTGGLSLAGASPTVVTGPYFIEANTQDSGSVWTFIPIPSSGCTASFQPWDLPGQSSPLIVTIN